MFFKKPIFKIGFFAENYKMTKIQRIQAISCLLLCCVLTAPVYAYELPAVEDRRADTTDLSVHNATFLRQGTKVSILGILKRNGKNYELIGTDGQRGAAFSLDLHPSLKIEDDLVDREVRAVGRMAYETMSMPHSGGTLYHFKLELYSIHPLR